MLSSSFMFQFCFCYLKKYHQNLRLCFEKISKGYPTHIFLMIFLGIQFVHLKLSSFYVQHEMPTLVIDNSCLGCPVFRFFQISLSTFNTGCDQGKKTAQPIFLVFDDGNLTISALKVAEIAKKFRKFFSRIFMMLYSKFAE